jgi:ABC-type multidrug transport system permease subunit
MLYLALARHGRGHPRGRADADVPAHLPQPGIRPAGDHAGWLQAIARANPVTCAVDALRALLADGPTARPVLLATAWIVGLVVVFAPLAVRRYRRG